MNRDNLDSGIVQAIAACLFLWLLIFIWEKVPSYGFWWEICLVLIGALMILCSTVIVAGFTSVQYESTRKFWSFTMGVLAVFLVSQIFRWHPSEWYVYLVALVLLLVIAKIFKILLEIMKFRRAFEALLITVIGINMLRVVTLL